MVERLNGSTVPCLSIGIASISLHPVRPSFFLPATPARAVGPIALGRERQISSLDQIDQIDQVANRAHRGTAGTAGTPSKLTAKVRPLPTCEKSRAKACGRKALPSDDELGCSAGDAVQRASAELGSPSSRRLIVWVC